ncbi:MFS transporter [uncultured Desulfobacter sp.]|uniref:MFS transporter n=1 Tax=uncultured Desulfobacter sp. TaxID=240139 RepID=UPI002AAB2F3C|nr:MFS transporter [uncultured Desulfobacter sp.]
MQPKRLIVIVVVFVCLTHLLYMVNNAAMFRQDYEDQSQAQMKELGAVVKSEIEYAMGFGIPVRSLGGMDAFLKGILDNTPELAFIRVESRDNILFSAKRASSSTRDILVPILSEGQETAVIRLGIGDELRRQIFSMLFDLSTIVFAGLIITFEVIRFFAAKLITTPYRQSIQALNKTIREMNPYQSITIPGEFQEFINEILRQVGLRNRQIYQMTGNLKYAAMFCSDCVGNAGRSLLKPIQAQQAALQKLIGQTTQTSRMVDPSQIRPVVFLFFLGANIQSSFLPIFARELLETKTFLSDLFSREILMGLPITCHMVMVFLVMLFMGSRQFKKKIPSDYMVSIGAFCTSAGLVICGFSENIVELVAGRMLCAVGFSFIVISCKQFIVQHSTPEDRSFHLAGFTAAFSGGLFCSIIIGSILADYFSYRFVFFCGAAIVLLIYVFDYMIMADKSASDLSDQTEETSGLGTFFAMGVTDMNLICVFIHGIFTRITFIGFFYFSLPILLKTDYTYADIGRMMMFYSVPSVLFGSAINKRIKKIGHSKMSVIGSNILVGIFLIFFFIPMQGPFWVKTLFIPFFLLVLGASNSITFPAQSALLLNTGTARTLGSRTALSVYNSFERIGSALGPVFYGFFISHFGMLPAVALGGGLCILGNIIFFLFFNPDKTLGETTP